MLAGYIDQLKINLKQNKVAINFDSINFNEPIQASRTQARLA